MKECGEDYFMTKDFCRPSYCKYCNPDKKVCISVIDSDGNFIDRDRYDEVYVDTHLIKLKLHDNIRLSNEELYLLKDMLIEDIEYGMSLPKTKKCLEILEKIEKALEKNRLNE